MNRNCLCVVQLFTFERNNTNPTREHNNEWGEISHIKKEERQSHKKNVKALFRSFFFSCSFPIDFLLSSPNNSPLSALFSFSHFYFPFIFRCVTTSTSVFVEKWNEMKKNAECVNEEWKLYFLCVFFQLLNDFDHDLLAGESEYKVVIKKYKRKLNKMAQPRRDFVLFFYSFLTQQTSLVVLNFICKTVEKKQPQKQFSLGFRSIFEELQLKSQFDYEIGWFELFAFPWIKWFTWEFLGKAKKNARKVEKWIFISLNQFLAVFWMNEFEVKVENCERVEFYHTTSLKVFFAVIPLLSTVDLVARTVAKASAINYH